MDGNGMTEQDAVKEGVEWNVNGQEKDVGRLYRIAMNKGGVWGGVPIEYARIQTDSPSRDGWNHEWTR